MLREQEWESDTSASSCYGQSQNTQNGTVPGSACEVRLSVINSRLTTLDHGLVAAKNAHGEAMDLPVATITVT